TEMDGFTVTLSLTMAVIPGAVNSIRIGIADTGDASYDSNLLIAADSVQTVVIANDDSVDLNPYGSKTLDVLGNDSGPGGSTLVITHINGVAVVAGQTVTLATGQQITLNADGTFTIVADGDTETVNFTYDIAINGVGQSATGIVTVNSIPCFVAGTRILTPGGEVAVEDLQPGDLVMTHDDGPQPLRWIGQRRVAAEGSFAPIRIRAGAFGAHRTLLVSPQHRVLIRDSLAELLFGEQEVLVAAKDLVNDRSVTVRAGGEVDYVHLLFDRHQVVYSEGLATESFLPGPQTTRSFENAIVEEICAIFPEIDPQTGAGYSPAARRTLRGYEAQVLLALGQAA
ncbi:MAG TPA: Hint domain-containing protein, partial [Paracoccaceae bacterium]